jgi:hypothetical protein
MNPPSDNGSRLRLEPGTYRALSVWQPWAWAIFNGKGIENRDWPVRFRGKLLIHASQTTRDVDRVKQLLAVERKLEIPPNALVFGAILGMVEVHECKWSPVVSPCGWGVANAYHWFLRDQTLIDQPIPYRGAQGIFHVHIPFENPSGKLLL